MATLAELVIGIIISYANYIHTYILYDSRSTWWYVYIITFMWEENDMKVIHCAKRSWLWIKIFWDKRSFNFGEAQELARACTQILQSLNRRLGAPTFTMEEFLEFQKHTLALSSFQAEINFVFKVVHCLFSRKQ